ncbi:acyltransferase [Demequina litorisediminis]|uniref:Acyltransferase n=1 Tax=Demequina litorisediminis TaxID=1849022 RepID=A0ABQ6IGR5_9MICO|nr:hypothetical protein GCM10025876_25650 [Demequina litorisediminis]
MTVITVLESFEDADGNVVEYRGTKPQGKIRVAFSGSGNRLVVHPGASLEGLDVSFDCNNGTMRIGNNPRGRKITVTARIGEDSTIDLGDDLSTTGRLAMSVAEGGTIRLAAGVMVAAECQIRADDAHPIFSIRTGKRVNPVKDIEIGEHVWLGMRSVVLGGARIERGSVIGLGSVVTGHVPNNCVAVGAPARVVRRDIAWERTHLTLKPPYYKPDAASLGDLSPYWDLTEAPEAPARPRACASACGASSPGADAPGARGHFPAGRDTSRRTRDDAARRTREAE